MPVRAANCLWLSELRPRNGPPEVRRRHWRREPPTPFGFLDQRQGATAAAVSRETSAIGVEETGGAHYGLDQGRILEHKGPDGPIKRVRS